MSRTTGSIAFQQARDVLLHHRTDVEGARSTFRWPELDEFNWVWDWFDVIAQGNPRPALTIVTDTGLATSVSFADLTEAVMADGYYRTGDEAQRDADGYIHVVGRGDDVFKSSDYRISPFELESVLIEHEAVAEAAVVPSPDPLRLYVPKAFIQLKAGVAETQDTARAIFEFCNAKLAAYKRIRRLSFAALPKTISGKIRRVELRKLEAGLRAQDQRQEGEFWLDDLKR